MAESIIKVKQNPDNLKWVVEEQGFIWGEFADKGVADWLQGWIPQSRITLQAVGNLTGLQDTGSGIDYHNGIINKLKEYLVVLDHWNVASRNWLAYKYPEYYSIPDKVKSAIRRHENAIARIQRG